MKKIAKSLLTVLVFVAVNVAVAQSTPLQTALIINESQYPITIKYSQCGGGFNNGNEICTLGSPTTIATKSGQNVVEVGIASSTLFLKVFDAVATDSSGNVVAKTDHTCEMYAAHNGVIILKDYGSRLVCQYAE